MLCSSKSLENVSVPILDNSTIPNSGIVILTHTQTVYAILECLVSACSTLGNSLIVASFIRDRTVRTPTNTYVFSLALADLLVSVVGIPIYLYSMLTRSPSDHWSCLVVNTWIMMLCTVSIFHLVAVSFDRYMAIVWLRQGDSRKERMRQACFSITIAWIFGTVIGFLPLMGWNRGPSVRGVCDFMEIMDMRYLMFLFYFTIITPTLLMAFFYVSIFYVVRRQDNRMARRNRFSSESEPAGSSISDKSDYRERRFSYRKRGDQELSMETRRRDSSNEGTFSSQSRPSAIQSRRGVSFKESMKKKAAKSSRVIFSFLLVIVSFLTSWYPLYTLNAITFYSPHYPISQTAFYICIVLSHMSSMANPLIYARTMPGFKRVLMETLLCQKTGTRRRHSSFSLLYNSTNANRDIALIVR